MYVTACVMPEHVSPSLCPTMRCQQHQLLRCPHLRLSKIEAIFITHLHGDHLFGLPGLLCTMSATNTEEGRCVTVVGTKGISDYIAHSMLLSHSYLSYKLHVIELLPPSHTASAASSSTGTATAVGTLRLHTVMGIFPVVWRWTSCLSIAKCR